MKKVLFFACLCSMLAGFVSCETKNAAIDEIDEITIYGNVIDRRTGQPLYNVLIQEKNRVGGSTVTGSDGNYEFTLPLNGRSEGVFTLVASKSLYSDAVYELFLNNVDRGRKIKVDFQLETGVYYVEGKVTDTNGSPLSNVLIKETYHNVGNSAYTDNEGNYKLELYPYSENSNQYVLTASATNYYSEEYTLIFTQKDYGRTSTVNFHLGTGAFYVEGKVTDTKGSPLSNVLIKETYHNVGNSAYTDNEGNYKLELYPYSENSNKYVLTASATNYYSEEYTLNFTKDDYGRTSTVNFQLTSSVTPVIYCYVKGNVTTTPGSRWPNQPVGYVLIECFKHTEKNTVGTNLIVTAYTDTQGNYTIKVPIDKDFPYYTFKASKSHWGIWEHQEGNTLYTKKTLLLNENMENQTFYINWKAYEQDSYATLD